MKTLATYQQEAREALRDAVKVSGETEKLDGLAEIYRRFWYDELYPKLAPHIDNLISRTLSEIEKEVVPKSRKVEGVTDFGYFQMGWNECRFNVVRAFTRIRGDEKKSYYRHCEGGVGGPDDAENHWKCSGDGDDGPCECPCHSSPSEEKV